MPCSTLFLALRLPLSHVFCVFVVMCPSAHSFAEWHSDTQGIMGTEVSVTLWSEDPVVAKKAIESVMKDMRRIDNTLSPYKPQSELSRVNREAAKTKQSLSSELAMLVDKSLYFSRVSEGAFDITFASLGQHYDFRSSKQPDEKQLKNLLPAINYEWLDFDREARTLAFAHKDVKIDLGGVAKGHAVDRAAQILWQQGIRHASISAGGDSQIIGDRRGRPWTIGIKNPRLIDSGKVVRDDQAVIRLPLVNTAMSTSGDYERYFIDEDSGERIHHILNPKTGKSASELVSVTILGRRGIDTDAMSTSVFVMGVEKGLAFLNSMPHFDGILIDKYGKVHYSNGLVEPE